MKYYKTAKTMISKKYSKRSRILPVIISTAIIFTGCQHNTDQGCGAPIKHNTIPEGFYSEVIPYSSFAKNFNDRIRYEHIVSKGQPINKSKVAQFYVQSWNDLYIQALLKPEVNYLGLAVTQDEINDLTFGNHPHESIRNLPFLKDKNGVFQPSLAKDFINRIKNDTSSDPKVTWEVFVREIENKYQSDKHQKLLSLAMFVTPAEEEYYNYYQSTEIDFDYAFKSFATLNIEIPHDSLLVNLYKKYEDDYFKPESRKVAYITAKPIIDPDNHTEELKRFSALKNHVAADFKALSEKNPAIKFFATEYNIASVQGATQEFFQKGKTNDVYGPVFQSNSYRMTKIIEKYERPDSVKIRHIVLSGADTLLIPKLTKEIHEKKNFDELAARYSIDKKNKDQGGLIGWVKYGDLVEPFNTACFSAPGDFYFEISGSYGKHLIHIMEISSSKSEYVYADVLYMEIEPNEKDFANLEKIVNRISKQAKSSEDLFAHAIEHGFATTNISLQNTYYNVPEIDNSNDIVQWCFKNSKNKISPPFKKGNNVYIVFVSDILPTGNLPFYEVRDIVKDDFVMLFRKDTLYDRTKPLIDDTKSLEENAKVMGSPVIGIKKMVLASYDIPSLGIENDLRGILMGMKVGQTSKLFKGDKGLFIVRKTAERKIKPKSTPQIRLKNQYLADVENDVHLGDISSNAKAFLNFVRQQDSYFLLKTYKNLLPEDKEAARAMWSAEHAFRKGNWEESLNGTQTYKGFKEFIQKSDKETKQSRLAKIYAAICYMKINDFQSAIPLLASIEPTEDYFMSTLVPILLGDAYALTNKPLDAVAHYKNAIEKGNSKFYQAIAMHKLALHYYMLGEYNNAKEMCKLLLAKNVSHHHGQVVTELLKKLETQCSE